MNKEEILQKIKDIHLLYTIPYRAENMRPEHYAIVEYEKLLYEQRAEIDKLEQENKKYKEVIDKANKYIDKMFKTGFYNDDYYLGHLKMILEDKEVK